MKAQAIAALILSPFALAFVYAGIHEYMRFKSEGKATYGLVYDEDSGTSHVTRLDEDEDPFDPEDFDPSAANGTDEDAPEVADERGAEDETTEKV